MPKKPKKLTPAQRFAQNWENRVAEIVKSVMFEPRFSSSEELDAKLNVGTFLAEAAFKRLQAIPTMNDDIISDLPSGGPCDD